MRRPRGAAALDWVTVLLGIATAVVVATRVLDDRDDTARERISLPQAPVVLISIPGGTSRDVRMGSGAPAVWLFYRETCSVCTAQRPVWRQLLQRLPRAVERHVVSTAPRPDAEPYLGMEGVWESYPADPAALANALGLTGVPATLFIDAAGRVDYAEIDLLNAKEADELVSRARRTTRVDR